MMGGSLPSQSCFVRVFGFQQIPSLTLFLLRQKKDTKGRLEMPNGPSEGEYLLEMQEEPELINS